MIPYNSEERARWRKRRRTIRRITVAAECLAIVAILAAGAMFIGTKIKHAAGNSQNAASGAATASNQASTEEINLTDNSSQSQAASETASPETPAESLLSRASALAAGYDYDKAISLLQEDAQTASLPEVQSAIAQYETIRQSLVRTPISQVTHVFFHSLIVDPAKAFDGQSDQDGYNQVMTTVDEFKKILQTMYDKGYVLVRLHDLACETTDETGKTVMKAGDIMLPEGKIPFVMSQDDLCYYPYMDGDGFASRIVIGEDGKPTCEMILEDGTAVTGSYDLVPILEDFIQEHPDFSYRGARAVLAFTGYEGILGYRTAASYADSPTYEQDRQEAAKVAQCLKDHGWELASHSWGHLDLGTVEWDRFKTDTDKWETEVDSLIGPTDIILYPFGADVVFNANAFVSQYCAHKDTEIASISKEDMEALLTANKDKLYSFAFTDEEREIPPEQGDEDSGETIHETIRIYTISYNGEAYFADQVFHLSDDQKLLASQYAQNLTVLLGDGIYQGLSETEFSAMGLSYDGVIFADGETQVVYYNQLDERWKYSPYGTDTIGGYACGPTAMAIVISSLTSETIDPPHMAQWAYEHGYWCSGNGSYRSLIPGAAQAWSLSVDGCTASEPQRIIDALAEGKLVVALMTKGHFTSSGHFIVLRGCTSDGKILVADPSSYKRSEKSWDMSIILNEASKRAGSGGPFWIIGN